MEKKYALFLSFLLLVQFASAGTYLFQGDKVYWGDKVDLTGVYGWQCTVAWWKDGASTIIQPTKIEDVCTNSYNIEITTERFPRGIWYKWDGSLSSSGNEKAFEVVGPRPVTTRPTSNLSSNQTLNLTATPTQVVTTTPPTLVPTMIPTIQSTPVPTAVVTVTVTPEESVWPKLPPLPVIIVLVICGGLLVRWWINDQV